MKQRIIQNVKIRRVVAGDLDECFTIESTCYTTDAANREKIEKRIALFPAGFLVAEVNGQVVGMINSGATNKEDITDDAFKDMIDHINHGKHIVIFSLAVLPEFQGVGISRKLMVKFIEVSRGLKKEKILLMCKSGANFLLPEIRLCFTLENQSRHLAVSNGTKCIYRCKGHRYFQNKTLWYRQ